MHELEHVYIYVFGREMETGGVRTGSKPCPFNSEL